MVDINMKWNDYPSDTLYLWNGNTLFIISEGTGCNLSFEDIEAGYEDYWMTEICSKDETSYGGQWMETELISKIDYTIQGVIDRIKECDLWEDNWKIIDYEHGEILFNALEKYSEIKTKFDSAKDELEKAIKEIEKE